MISKRLIHRTIVSVIGFAWSTVALAHPGGHGPSGTQTSQGSRTWTLAESGAHWHGSFVSSKDDQATFQRDDGKVISIAIDRLIQSDRQWIENRVVEIERLNESASEAELAQSESDQRSATHNASGPQTAPTIHQHFTPFKKTLGLRWDDRYYHVESNGLPDHPMMVGISAWNQQVPIPHRYTGSNAFRIPLKPTIADEPTPAPYLNAIAVAVNGVPIFHPIKQDGRTDTLQAGELDKYGGHAGRGDDYHYHIAPTHLSKIVGDGKPVAYALDGYPIIPAPEKDGKPTIELDKLNGATDAEGNYAYYATSQFPYIMPGFRGDVDWSLQPRARGVRPYTRPLRGAEITGFEHPDDDRYRLTYEHQGREFVIEYQTSEEGSVRYTFVDPDGNKTTETYERREQGRGRQRGNGPGRRIDRDELDRLIDEVLESDERSSRRSSENFRQPWIVVHAKELDTNSDRIVSRKEMTDEAARAFSGYDRDSDGVLLSEEYAGRGNVRSAMGGFIRGHAAELDRDSDGKLTKVEVISNAERMFDRADRNSDGQLTQDELQPASQSPNDRRGRGSERSSDERRSESREANRSSATLSSDAGRGLPERPNVVLILIDDMGWKDMGFSGNRFVETPNADRLASEGVIFSQAYASAPNCAPTRACLLSGQYPPRHGVFTVGDERHSPGQPHHRILATPSNESMSGDIVTIPEALKDAGYATGCFGMWNLGRGRFGPSTATGQGFDIYKKPQDLGFDRHAYLDREGRYLTDVLFDEGLRFIEDNADRPFFLYLPTHAIHAPFEPKPELLAKYRCKVEHSDESKVDPIYAAMIEAVDQNISRLMQTLNRLNLSENTMVVFTSDNGGTTKYVAPLNGSKGALYEGGIRVPAFVWWSKISDPGRTSSEPISSIDFFPTILDAANLTVPRNHHLDGESLMPILTESSRLNRETLYWHFPCYIGKSSPCSAVRLGDYKLIEFYESGQVELYDLVADPGETRNLASDFPDVMARVHESLADWRLETNAPVPSTPNPEFDPDSIRRGGQKGRRNPQNRQRSRRNPDAFE